MHFFRERQSAETASAPMIFLNNDCIRLHRNGPEHVLNPSQGDIAAALEAYGTVPYIVASTLGTSIGSYTNLASIGTESQGTEGQPVTILYDILYPDPNTVDLLPIHGRTSENATLATALGPGLGDGTGFCRPLTLSVNTDFDAIPLSASFKVRPEADELLIHFKGPFAADRQGIPSISTPVDFDTLSTARSSGEFDLQGPEGRIDNVPAFQLQPAAEILGTGPA